MRISSDTGLPILNEIEQIRSSLAENGLDTIMSIKDDALLLIDRIARLRANTTLLNIKTADLVNAKLVIFQELDELLTPDYDRLHEQSFSGFYPDRISDYNPKI